MQFLAFILIYPILWLISILPFRLLYLFSDFICFLIYRIVKYRKKTVRENLALALPHLTREERIVIEKKFYHHMCDLFLEMIKTMTISDAEINKRFVFKNIDVLRNLEKKGKSIALLTGHYASYEWVISMNRILEIKGIAIYKRIRNKYFDKLVRDIRSRFKAYLITTKETATVMAENNAKNELCIYGFAGDQSPKSNAVHWNTFMGIETPIHTGAEFLSKRFDMNVVYLEVQKVKRGYYEATFEILSEDVKSVPDYEITDTFIRKLEQQILKAPEYYLWTHKRWKYRR
jgi:Kdo2-lipid IVA lauroyltransferase/acyltransferase